MSSPAITINQSAPLSEALVVMRTYRVWRLPVVDDLGTLCGIITYGDLRDSEVVRAFGVRVPDLAIALQHVFVYEVMARHPIAITPTTSLREAGRLIVEHEVSGLPVVERDNTVAGIITESDVFKVLVSCADREQPARADTHLPRGQHRVTTAGHR